MHFPPRAAFRHVSAREGFEVAFLWEGRFEGTTTAVEAGELWVVSYVISFDARHHTRRAHVTGRSARGARELILEADGAGQWLVDGQRAPHLDGCLDVDLESSALTNALPVRRLSLSIGEQREAPAAYVRAVGLEVERLEQRYRRVAEQRHAYDSPAFGFHCELVFDEHGVVLDYPGIAVRVA
jgi:uncharacterized protein